MPHQKFQEKKTIFRENGRDLRPPYLPFNTELENTRIYKTEREKAKKELGKPYKKDQKTTLKHNISDFCHTVSKEE